MNTVGRSVDMYTKEQLLVDMKFVKDTRNNNPKLVQTLERQILSKKYKSSNPVDKISACQCLGDKYLMGKGVPVNIQRALNYYLEASELGDGSSQLIVSKILLERGSQLTDEASRKLDFKEFLEKASKNGEPQANVSLANCYFKGIHGYPKEPERAFKLLQAVEHTNDPGVLQNLAISYLQGCGTRVDVKAAFRIFKKILVIHKDNCMYTRLGSCYEHESMRNYEKAVQCYQTAIVKAKDPQAKFLLSRCMRENHGIKKDDKKIFQLLKESADEGCREALRELAVLKVQHQYMPATADLKLASEEIEQDDREIWELLKESAGKKDVQSLVAMGNGYQDGAFGERDDKLAFLYFHAAAKQDFPEAQYKVGHCFFHGKGIKQNYLKAVEWFLKADANDNHYATYHLALCHLEGKGIIQDKKKARELLISLNTKHPEFAPAKLVLANLYDEGIGGSRDFKKTRELLNESEQSVSAPINALAKYNQAILLLRGGCDVAKDEKKALELLLEIEKSEQIKDPYMGVVYEALCNCYRFGKGTEVDLKKYCGYLIKVIGSSPSAEKHLELANFYMRGKVISKDPKKAFAHYRAAATLGSLKALNSLAFCYLQGIGTEKNEIEAVKIWQKAIEIDEKELQKHNNFESLPDTINNLGWCYLNGLGVKEDREKAFTLFHEAYSKGSMLGKHHVGLCYLNGWGVELDQQKAYEILIPKGPQDLPNEEALLLGIRHDLEYSTVLNHEKEFTEQRNYILYNIGLFHFLGYATAKQDFKCGIEFWRIAAETCIAARVELAVCDLQGYGVEKDVKRAYEMLNQIYKEFPNQPNVVAWIGHCQIEGLGTKADPKKAREFMESVRNPDFMCQYMLGKCYEFGIGGRQDIERAIDLYRRSAEKGYHQAQYQLGRLLEDKIAKMTRKTNSENSQDSINSGNSQYSEHSEKLLREAIQNYEKAVNQEHDDAILSLAGCAERLGQTKYAFALYKKYAFRGYIEGMKHLERCFRNGIGVEKDHMVADCAHEEVRELERNLRFEKNGY